MRPEVLQLPTRHNNRFVHLGKINRRCGALLSPFTDVSSKVAGQTICARKLRNSPGKPFSHASDMPRRAGAPLAVGLHPAGQPRRRQFS